VRALLLANLAQQPVGDGVSGRAPVQLVDLFVLGCLPGGQEPVDGRDPRLQAQPQRQTHAGGIGHLHPQLSHPGLQAGAVAALGLGHPPQDVGFPLGHPPGDQVVDGAGDDLAPPGLEEALAHLGGSLSHHPEASHGTR